MRFDLGQAGLARSSMKAAVAAAFGLLVASANTEPASAHGGEDHGEAQAPSGGPASQPRVTVHSDAFELVGVREGEQLTLFLDRYGTNEPVTDAAISVTVGDAGAPVVAVPTPEGGYRLTSPQLAGPDATDLIFDITGPAGADLLIGALPGTASGAVPAPAPSDRTAETDDVVVFGIPIARMTAVAASMLVLGVCLGLMLRQPARVRVGRGSILRRLAPATGVAALGLLAITAAAYSAVGGGGTEADGPGATQAAAKPGAPDTPRRLADGSAFVPKATQRLLEVRTVVAAAEAAWSAVQFTGRVIADPNRGGVVQSLTGGRIVATAAGLPHVGQAVRRGQVLAWVERALPPEERVNIAEMAGELDQLTAVAETRLLRARQLLARNAAPQSQVIDAEVELEGLRRRRETIRTTRAELEELLAPADGVVAVAGVALGQVVQADDVLFEIVDPQGLWVEALAYGAFDPGSLDQAQATGPGGRPMRLAFRGFSAALQNQASVLQFAILEPPAGLSVGQPVTVVAQSGAPVAGLVLPKAAVVRGPNGEALVWRHPDPEGFVGGPVRTQPLDAGRVLVVGGLAEGERVVVGAAGLINEIR